MKKEKFIRHTQVIKVRKRKIKMANLEKILLAQNKVKIGHKITQLRKQIIWEWTWFDEINSKYEIQTGEQETASTDDWKQKTTLILELKK